ncbi:CRISPR-associated protein, Csd1 family [hydrothermal vent metagenome]|uniref:CRISPR-associated protein, Csd1 family n=1 Tax=hydrothermal vent metagenome TaxID=652676 RepID=A0A1W1DZD7_9ZZZZ
MSWMQKLYDTYEKAVRLDDKPMPISHTIQNAHINIIIDGEGNFKRAEVLEKTQIILPATENSASRSSGESPHPLADKIQYVAKDYPDYNGKKSTYFKGYLQNLTQWCDSQYSNNKIHAIKKYVEKGSVVKDLIASKILFVNESNSLLLSWSGDKDNIPKIFKVLPKEAGKLDQGNALVCWSVEIVGDSSSKTWEDISIQKYWIEYDSNHNEHKELCYITGKNLQVAFNHPAKLRHSGDKAKLISSNDMGGYTFRGRFTDNKKSIEKNGLQAVNISFDVTQKAHNALRWLIKRQGFRNGDQVILAWAVSGCDIPQPTKDVFDFLTEPMEESAVVNISAGDTDNTANLGYQFANNLNKYMRGYQAKIEDNDSIVIMALNSATPGRMAITYYQEFLPSKYIDIITKWHNDFAWYQRYSKKIEPNNPKSKTITVFPIAAPNIKAIYETVYGTHITDSLKKNVVERLLPCIIEGKKIPRDLTLKAIERVSNKQAYKNDEQWLWEKHLGVACALFKGYSKRTLNKEYEMAVEEENNSRDYLFGRLLAIAERIEDDALSVAKEKRLSNAARLMQKFADRPASTWKNIELGLDPYIKRLNNNRAGFLHNMQNLLDEVSDKLATQDFTDEKLSGVFLLAYHSQRKFFKEWMTKEGKWVLKTENQNDDKTLQGEEE